MAKNKASPKSGGQWAFFAATRDLLSAFPLASTGQKSAIVGMSFLCVMFVIAVTRGGASLPPMALVGLFLLAALCIISITVMLVLVERQVSAKFQCRHVPIYPPDNESLSGLQAALNEIRADAAQQISQSVPQVDDESIRANIFLLAKIQGGEFDGQWKLVIHDDLSINMSLPAERQVQFAVGQGSTGIAYRDGIHQLTRRLRSVAPGTHWDNKFQMTPQLETQIEPRLKWILSFPLFRPNTISEAVGVLNIDGLIDVADDDVLNRFATSVRHKVGEVGEYLSRQQSICIGFDQLGVMKHV